MKYQHPELAKIEECTGCGSCAAVCPVGCIQMKSDNYGFLFPYCNTDQCVGCKKCEAHCPILNEIETEHDFQDAFAAYSEDVLIREKGSSGGLFFELADTVLAKKGIVYGAVFDDNYKVVHIGVEDRQELEKMSGAKYAQSDVNTCFISIRDQLREGKEVLFSGCPCQVAGLISFLGEKPYNLSTIDFVCHGVPSPLAWQKYVQYRAEKDNNGILPNYINLRSKASGWSKYRYSNVYQYANTEYKSESSQDLFMKLFTGDAILRQSCADCIFKGYDRASDLTLGDFWGIWDILPEMDDDKGTSLLLIHSKKGHEMIQAISDRLIMRRMSLRDTSNYNPSMLYSVKPHPKREQILRLFCSGEIDKAKKIFDSAKSVRTNKLIRKFLKAIID